MVDSMVWTKMYSLINQGILRKGKEYFVKKAGYDCYIVKNNGGYIYSSMINFTHEKPKEERVEELDDEEIDSYDWYDDRDYD